MSVTFTVNSVIVYFIDNTDNEEPVKVETYFK